MADIVERYLDAIVSHDWDVVAECVADDIVRVGPFGDRYDGRDDYLAFTPTRCRSSRAMR
jgi:ketosteroid isomerase-like protein